MRTKGKLQHNTSDLVISSPQVKKLKEDILLLRKKSREDGIKIKCLQNKIRRLLRKSGKSKENRKGGQVSEGGLKRRVQFLTDDESTDSSPASPSACFVDRVNFDMDVNLESKTEPMNGESTNAGSSVTPLADQDTGFEAYAMIEEIKAEIEDDPLMTLGGFSG